jgi:hypothetical protein
MCIFDVLANRKILDWQQAAQRVVLSRDAPTSTPHLEAQREARWDTALDVKEVAHEEAREPGLAEVAQHCVGRRPNAD